MLSPPEVALICKLSVPTLASKYLLPSDEPIILRSLPPIVSSPVILISPVTSTPLETSRFPVTDAPPLVVSNFLLLLWYNSTAPSKRALILVSFEDPFSKKKPELSEALNLNLSDALSPSSGSKVNIASTPSPPDIFTPSLVVSSFLLLLWYNSTAPFLMNFAISSLSE